MKLYFVKYFMLLILILPLMSCSQSKDSSNIWTIISINNKEAYFYKGELTNKSKAEKISLIDTLLINKLTSEVKLQNQSKDSIILILKPTEESTQMGMFDLQKFAEKIGVEQNYGFVVLTKQEKEYFDLHDVDFTPPELVEIKSPKSIISQDLPIDNAMLIEIKKDNTVWCRILSSGSDSLYNKIETPITNNLSSILKNYIQRKNGKRISFLIKNEIEDNNQKFEQVIEALKGNNIYKYNLITALSQ